MCRYIQFPGEIREERVREENILYYCIMRGTTGKQRREQSRVHDKA